MLARKLAFATLLLTAVAGAAGASDLPMKAAKSPPPPPPFFFVNSNSISYHYEFTANNPGAGQTPKHVVSFTHFDVWAYGTNYFNVDWLRATNHSAPPNGAPAAPCDFTGTSDCQAYTEIYGLFRSTLGWNQLSGSKMFSMEPLTNIEFVVGADLNTDNTTLGSAKRSIQGGIQFDFATPYKGFLSIAPVVYHEWQHDGFASNLPIFGANNNLSGNVDFNTTWGVEALYSQPLGFLPPSIPLTYKLLAVIHGPKGCGEPCGPGPGLARTNEYLTQQTLNLDVGQMVWNKPGLLAVWGGYRWWKNKFGIDPDQFGGHFSQTVESTWLLGVSMGF